MEKSETKSHVAVLAEVRETIGRLLKDPLLTHLHPEITPGEINSQLNVLHGRALTLLLRTYNDEIIPVVVLQGCTVRDVMKAVERDVSSKSRGMSFSWRYVWRTYWLAYGQTRLEDYSAKLVDYGVGSNSELRFVRKLRKGSL